MIDQTEDMMAHPCAYDGRARRRDAHTYPKPGQLQHLRQAYIPFGAHWAEQHCQDADDRRGFTAFECLGCGDVELSRRRFLEKSDGRDKRIRAWKRAHKACPKRLIEVFRTHVQNQEANRESPTPN